MTEGVSTTQQEQSLQLSNCTGFLSQRVVLIELKNAIPQTKFILSCAVLDIWTKLQSWWNRLTAEQPADQIGLPDVGV